MNEKLREKYLAIKLNFPNAFIFWKYSGHYVAYLEDALVASKMFKMDFSTFKGAESVEFSYEIVNDCLKELVRAGYRICVVDVRKYLYD